MRCERYALGGEPAALAGELRALIPASRTVSSTVAEIVAQVRGAGDAAVHRYTRELDLGGGEPPPLRLEEEELIAAERRLDSELRRALEAAIGNVRRVAEATPRDTVTVELATHTVLVRREPVARAAVYAPGGRAPYPSTVVMGVVPAQVAGVGEIAVCTPPDRQGEVPPVIAAACRLAGVTAVYRMGGAQAIAALAYGTESVTAVDLIVGPGNLYVQEAKRQVFGDVGIDGFAGPSDLLVIADADADPELISLDLLAQAEHGSGTLVVAVGCAGSVLDAVAGRMRVAPETGAVAALVDVKRLEDALGLAEEFAPEHLELIGAAAEALAPEVHRAGCLFIGSRSGTAFGDYIAGSNHILPTARAARFASGLTPEHFLRTMAEVRIARPSELAREAAPLARAEGFEQHARSMEARIGDNQPREPERRNRTGDG
ncbi:MAG TPA: histidinol dehydrogenase [Solirubrobacteraceae bacterium]|nr:histidinol dehydrogenase [Solirubrobacteraceae bacterium]